LVELLFKIQQLFIAIYKRSGGCLVLK